jgi:hypothetical protein
LCTGWPASLPMMSQQAISSAEQQAIMVMSGRCEKPDE